MPEFFQKINWIDCLIIIFLIRCGYIGFVSGLGWEVIRVLDHLVVTFITIFFYNRVAEIITTSLPALESFSFAIAFFVLYVSLFSVLRLFYLLLTNVVGLRVFSPLQRWLGLMLGLIRGSLFVSLILVSLVLFPTVYFKKSVAERSLLGSSFVKIAPVLYENAGAVFSKSKDSDKTKVINESIKCEK